MVDIGLQFYQHQPYPGGLPWGQSHGLRIYLKSQNFCVLVCIAIPSRPFEEFHLYYTCWLI